MQLIEVLLQKATKGGGFESLTKMETEELKSLSKIAAYYEDHVLKMMPLPVTLTDMIERKMKELNLNQVQLAEKLQIGTAKLSQILNGKRNPDVKFLKKIHEELGIDANFILEHV